LVFCATAGHFSLRSGVFLPKTAENGKRTFYNDDFALFFFDCQRGWCIILVADWGEASA
jgi:hypothetical protein